MPVSVPEYYTEGKRKAKDKIFALLPKFRIFYDLNIRYITTGKVYHDPDR
jgi:hypothetical protein